MQGKRKSEDFDLDKKTIEEFCGQFQAVLGPAMKKCKNQDQLVALLATITDDVVQHAAKELKELPKVTKEAWKEAYSKKMSANKEVQNFLRPKRNVPVSSKTSSVFRHEEETNEEKTESTAFKQFSFWCTMFLFLSVSVATGVSFMEIWEQKILASLILFGQAVCLFFFGSIFDKVNEIMEAIVCLVLSKIKALLWIILTIIMVVFVVTAVYLIVESLNLDSSTKYTAMAFFVTVFGTFGFTVQVILWLI